MSDSKTFFTFGPGKPERLFAIAAAIIALAAALANTENYNMLTYYPVAYGSYSKLVTTDKTILARDGDAVEIGSSANPAKLAVYGSVSVTGNLISSGPITVGTPAGNFATAGAIQWNGTDFLAYYGSDGWKKLVTEKNFKTFR